MKDARQKKEKNVTVVMTEDQHSIFMEYRRKIEEETGFSLSYSATMLHAFMKVAKEKLSG